MTILEIGSSKLLLSFIEMGAHKRKPTKSKANHNIKDTYWKEKKRPSLTEDTCHWNLVYLEERMTEWFSYSWPLNWIPWQQWLQKFYKVSEISKTKFIHNDKKEMKTTDEWKFKLIKTYCQNINGFFIYS